MGWLEVVVKIFEYLAIIAICFAIAWAFRGFARQ